MPVAIKLFISWMPPPTLLLCKKPIHQFTQGPSLELFSIQIVSDIQFKVQSHTHKLLGAVLHTRVRVNNKVMSFCSVKPQTEFSSEENNHNLSGLKMESLG